LDIESRGKTLLFAMNGGMFTKDFTPLGLYIKNEEILSPIKKAISRYGNFYMPPNGIFYVDKEGNADVAITQNFKNNSTVNYATQSGPMLVHNDTLNSNFGPQSTSLHVRNGVGILPNGNALFAMSKVRVNLYATADFFKAREYKNLLYLDGFVSRTFLPSKIFEQTDGQFGVMIVEVE